MRTESHLWIYPSICTTICNLTYEGLRLRFLTQWSLSFELLARLTNSTYPPYSISSHKNLEFSETV